VIRCPREMRVRPDVARISAEKIEVGESSLAKRVFLRKVSAGRLRGTEMGDREVDRLDRKRKKRQVFGRSYHKE
jgi:hypothetical protein